jgi:hypothetical protein
LFCFCWSGSSSSLAFHSFLFVSWSDDEPPGCGGNVRFLSCADLFSSWPWLFVPKEIISSCNFYFYFSAFLWTTEDGGDWFGMTFFWFCRV